jgi:hypothetical protein
MAKAKKQKIDSKFDALMKRVILVNPKKDKYKTYLLIHIFDEYTLNQDKRRDKVRDILEKDGAILAEKFGQIMSDYTTFESEKSFDSVLKSMIGQFEKRDALILVERNTRRSRFYIQPSSLSDKLKPERQINFQTFPLQVRKILEEHFDCYV